MPSIPSVSILIRQPYPLNRQLDASAGELVLRKIEAMGVEVKTFCQPSDIITTVDAKGQETFRGFKITAEAGEVEKEIESDMVIFAIGIKPRDDLATGAGIKVAKRGGIDVGDDLKTSVDDVYAIGECASWRGNVSLTFGSPCLGKF